MIRIPNRRKDYVASFCRSVVQGQMPKLVSHEPLADKPFNECFSIVPEHIAAHGGKEQFGWAIFELKRVWLEAEFHVVWEREDGVLVDLTPRQAPLEHILFLPDPERRYDGTQVNSIIRALSKKPSVQRFITLHREYYLALNEGDLANVQRGMIRSPRAVALKQEMDQLMTQIVREHYG